MDSDLHVINDPSKVNNILNLLSKTNTILNLRNLLTEYNGRIKEVTSDQFKFTPNIKNLQLPKQIQFSFYYLDKYHYFTSDLLDTDNNKKDLIFKVPKKIFIHFRRRDKRFEMDNSDISCNLKVINVKGETREVRKIKRLFDNIEFVYEELEKDKPDFSRVVQLIAENNKNFCNDFRIIMPIFNLPNKSFIPFLIGHKKPLLISCTQDKDSYLTKYPDDTVLSLKDYINFISERGNKYISDEMNILIQFFKENNIYSILYVPLIVLGDVIGVLRIANTNSRKVRLSLSDVNYFCSIAEILNELIIKNKLNSLDDTSLKIDVKDLSVMGIGIEVDDSVFSTYLKAGTKLKVILNFNKKPWLFFIGTVKRSIKKGNKFEIGIMIHEIIAEHRVKLINYINNHFLKTENSE
ncbi:MAG: PilZ domain-containing protein [Spirochaetes bacterium]|nr:PilZ domain-containing protein [Spirochaetota bacterium]